MNIKNIIISGSHGNITINEFGRIISCDEGEYKSIKEFDAFEWINHYNKPFPSNLDILDMGYWLYDGTYEPPCYDWRNEFRKQ